MAKVIKISGYEEFKQKIDEIAKSSEHVNVLFSGKKDAAGRSWCSDCNDAEPTVQLYCIEKAEPNSIFVIVDAGDRPTWKDMKNAFRLDKSTHLSVIPTLINWKQKEKRLEGEQLCKPELLEMYFEDE